MGNIKKTVAATGNAARLAKVQEMHRWAPMGVIWRYFMDWRVGWLRKLFMLAALFYLISPDPIPTEIDDTGIVAIAILVFVRGAFSRELERQLAASGEARDSSAIDTVGELVEGSAPVIIPRSYRAGTPVVGDGSTVVPKDLRELFGPPSGGGK